MEKVTFTCETVTPLFLAGADGTTPELRAPSIKGALRFWWRAMNGHLSLDELRKQEGEIFGSTSGRSNFAIHVTQYPNGNRKGKSFWDEIAFVERTSRNGKKYKEPKDDCRGIHYLLYSAFLNEREYYKNKTTFTFEISFQKLEDYECIINSLTGLLLFGGLGTRSRRGAGSFRVTKVTLEGFEDKGKIYRIFEEHLRQVDTVGKLKEHYQKLTSLLPQHDNISYSVLKGSKVYFFEPAVNWKDALEKIGKPFKNFRGEHKSDIRDTPNFGFPIQHRNEGVTMMAGKLKPNKKVDFLLERRSSPLLFKIIQTDVAFFPVIIWLSGDLLPDDYEIMDKKGDHNKLPDPKIIQDFISTLSPSYMVNL